MSQPMQLTAREHAKPCMIEVLEVKKTRGSTANGSCIDSTICDQTSNGVAPASPKIAIKEMAGAMASVRVINRRCHRGKSKS